MKTKTLILAGLLLVFCSVVKAQTGSTIIGTQTWATSNLDVTTFQNGDPIMEAESDSAWNKAGQDRKPAWCYYKNDPASGKTYGKLYNWFAVNDPRGLAPKGWHIPNEKDWKILLNDHVTDVTRDANIFKSATGWQDGYDGNNGNGNNSSGFSAYPGGYRYYGGAFYNIGERCYFWTSTEYDDGSAQSRQFSKLGGKVEFDSPFKGSGCSVRCIKD